MYASMYAFETTGSLDYRIELQPNDSEYNCNFSLYKHDDVWYKCTNADVDNRDCVDWQLPRKPLNNPMTAAVDEFLANNLLPTESGKCDLVFSWTPDEALPFRVEMQPNGSGHTC